MKWFLWRMLKALQIHRLPNDTERRLTSLPCASVKVEYITPKAVMYRNWLLSERKMQHTVVTIAATVIARATPMKALRSWGEKHLEWIMIQWSVLFRGKQNEKDGSHSHLVEKWKAKVAEHSSCAIVVQVTISRVEDPAQGPNRRHTFVRPETRAARLGYTVCLERTTNRLQIRFFAELIDERGFVPHHT